MSTCPENTLLIQYANLGSDPNWRLCVLSAIGTLLNRPIGFYTPAMLRLFPNEWHCLRAWIKQESVGQFWRMEDQGVHVIRACEKHILIGTGQLLADLRDVIRKPPGLDEVWVAAQSYISMEVMRKMD